MARKIAYHYANSCEEQIVRAFQLLPPRWKEMFVDAVQCYRYFISDEKLAALGWAEKTSWEEGLAKTIEWYTGKDIESYWAADDIEKALQPHPVL